MLGFASARKSAEIRRNTLSIRRNTQAKTPQANTPSKNTRSYRKKIHWQKGNNFDESLI